MTIGEFSIGLPTMIIGGTMVFTIIFGFLLLISGLPFLVINLYINHKNKVKVSFREILRKTYF